MRRTTHQIFEAYPGRARRTGFNLPPRAAPRLSRSILPLLQLLHPLGRRLLLFPMLPLVPVLPVVSLGVLVKKKNSHKDTKGNFSSRCLTGGPRRKPNLIENRRGGVVCWLRKRTRRACNRVDRFCASRQRFNFFQRARISAISFLLCLGDSREGCVNLAGPAAYDLAHAPRTSTIERPHALSKKSHLQKSR